MVPQIFFPSTCFLVSTCTWVPGFNVSCASFMSSICFLHQLYSDDNPLISAIELPGLEKIHFKCANSGCVNPSCAEKLRMLSQNLAIFDGGLPKTLFEIRVRSAMVCTDQRSSSNSPTARRLSTRMDTLFNTIINGTATSMPISPHVQLQKRSP